MHTADCAHPGPSLEVTESQGKEKEKEVISFQGIQQPSTTITGTYALYAYDKYVKIVHDIQ